MIVTAFVRIAWVPILLLLTACTGGTDEAARAVTEFRAKVARHSFGEIYRTGGLEFRRATTEEQFSRLMGALDRKLGAWQSAADPAWNVMRGTAGHLVNLTYQSQFAKGAATEQFLWRIEGRNAVLLGYHINSPLLIME